MDISPTPQIIGARIAQARAAAGLSLERVAVELDVSRDTVERYERGETIGGPSYISIVAIAKLTGRPVDWFMGETNGEAVVA